MIYSILSFLAIIASIDAACDNQCSGHGSCETDDVCKCYDNWGVGLSHDSGDCSDRICPFELAWVDTPRSIDTLSYVPQAQYHGYAECAGRGICDRSTGNCECFDGYEGKGCQRTTCPNDCSGHGTCEYIEDIRYRASWADFVDSSEHVNIHAPYPLHIHWEKEDPYTYFEQTTFRSQPAKVPYHQWDKTKIRGCVCDAQYADVDCSKRMCPYGTDILDVHDNLEVTAKYQQQQVSFYESFPHHTLNGKTFALTFKSKLNETFTTVPISFDYDHINDFETDVRLALISLPNHVIDDVIVNVDTASDAGGILGSADPLTNPDHDGTYEVTVIKIKFSGDAVQGKQNLLTVEAFECQNGCTPKVTGLPLDTTVTAKKHSNVTETVNSDYHSFECGRRGKCDYSSGLCQCFEGYTGDNCRTQTILV